jgi:spermidine/putrescine ABC transporter ATP-binding subunit
LLSKTKESIQNATTPGNQIGISIAGLRKRYGDVVALDGISLDVEPGSFVAILGPSGSGKSTLLGVIAGFVQPDDGTVMIGARDVTSLPAHKRNLGVVFQHYALFPHMTVQDNVAFPLQSRGMSRRQVYLEVQRALDLVGLRALGRRRPSQLSGGQQQRVALARALVYKPPVLLLDEPLGALDRRLRETMQTELKTLHRQVGITFVYVTHDQEEALWLADRVVVLNDGMIQQAGTPRELYDKPASRFVANFVGDCNVIDGTVVRRGAGVCEVVHNETGKVLARVQRELTGQTAAAAIRPEWFRLTNDAPGPQCITAQVALRAFVGSEVVLHCQSAFGKLIVRHSRSGPGIELASGVSEGATVTLTWSPEDAHVVSDHASEDGPVGGATPAVATGRAV